MQPVMETKKDTGNEDTDYNIGIAFTRFERMCSKYNG
jgi:hypothetical protein